MLQGLWMRLFGASPRTPQQWWAWAIEQAVKAGAEPHMVVDYAEEYLRAVTGERDGE